MQSGISTIKSKGVLQRTQGTDCEDVDWRITGLIATLLGEFQPDTMYAVV
jgi:hypothetical protein